MGLCRFRLAALRTAAGVIGRDASPEDIKARLSLLLDRSNPAKNEGGYDGREIGNDRGNERDAGRDTDRGRGHCL